MLKNTFRHIPGLGLKSESRLWASGVRSWDDFKEPFPEFLSLRKIELIRHYLHLSRKELASNTAFFVDLLNANQHWRLFPHFRDKTVYLDIETTGLSDFQDHITTIALYDGTTIKTYVYGENLDDFVADLDKYDVLVTYNGKTFDLPFIERHFGVKIVKAHIDLRYVLRGLGLSGGLKSCEKQLGIDRGDLDGVDGLFAVHLWQEYLATGSRKLLETLLAYNIEDVVNLEILMVQAYNLSLEKTPFFESHKLAAPICPSLPYHPDRECIREMRHKLQRFALNAY
jgi:hypothetical protein